jgi:hypothetical protein
MDAPDNILGYPVTVTKHLTSTVLWEWDVGPYHAALEAIILYGDDPPMEVFFYRGTVKSGKINSDSTSHDSKYVHDELEAFQWILKQIQEADAERGKRRGRTR